jgi:hypothetical protein
VHIKQIVGLLAASLAVSAAAACGGDSSPTAAAPTLSATPSASPSPTGKTATVLQYASAVNGSIKNLTERMTTYRDNSCSFREKPDLTCGMAFLGTGTNARLLALDIQLAMKVDGPRYIGAPPAELVGLLEETRKQADALATAVEAGGGVPTQAAKTAVRGEIFLMETVLAKWGPYL